MKLAFCLFKYFPYGGLQRDFLRIARVCLARGHKIDVYTMAWEGEVEPGLNIIRLSVKGWQNHTRNRRFVEAVAGKLHQQSYDVVLGFNKMPYLDIYYAADVCYQERVSSRSLFYHLLPRFRQQIAFEQAVFAKHKKTQILLIAAQQKAVFARYYQTEENRFHLLPPGISPDRMIPSHAPAIRQRIRMTHALKEDTLLLLMVGSGFKTKGVDRAIKALSALPKEIRERCQLFIIGQDNPERFLTLAKSLQVQPQVQFLGGRSDVADFLWSADLLLHPAYHENTGTVLLEAIVAGLPVLTVDVCGYAAYIKEAQVGMVLPSPFKQSVLNQALAEALLSNERAVWIKNALHFAKTADIYSLPERAADMIEKVGSSRAS